jgi:predicted MPP superfamily phosphohydrolase
MILFLLTFFLLYGGLHFYFFLKVRAAFAPGAAAQAILVTLLVLGLMAPILVRAAERLGFEILVRFVAWTGYVWMAVVLLFFSAGLLLDLYRLLAHAAALVLRTNVAGALPTARTLFFVPLAVAVVISGYGFFEARHIRTERVEVRSAKIPKTMGRLRIVQISDVHVGILVRQGRLAGMLQRVREAAPDVLVATGDLVDGQLDSIAEAAAQFREIRPRYGKFAVTGNHEFYAGLDDAVEFMGQAGFTLLRQEMTAVAGAIDLAGVDDPTIRPHGPRGGLSDRDVLSGTAGRSGRFAILLKHQPFVEKDAPGAFDLQLSGHTHKGQIFPFSLITRRFFPFHSGNYRLANDALLHVSRGTGTWGPPIRFLSPPEITVIDLVPG